MLELAKEEHDQEHEQGACDWSVEHPQCGGDTLSPLCSRPCFPALQSGGKTVSVGSKPHNFNKCYGSQ